MFLFLENKRNTTTAFLLHQCPFALFWCPTMLHVSDTLFAGAFETSLFVDATVIFDEHLVDAIVLFHACIMHGQEWVV